MDNEQQQGAGMRTREQILAGLRRAAKELNAGIDETRATLALEMVEQIRDEIRAENEAQRKIIEGIGTVALEAISLVKELAVAEYAGSNQAAAEKRAVLVRHGLVKGMKQE
jgi:hypothetical protein